MVEQARCQGRVDRVITFAIRLDVEIFNLCLLVELVIYFAHNQNERCPAIIHEDYCRFSTFVSNLNDVVLSYCECSAVTNLVCIIILFIRRDRMRGAVLLTRCDGLRTAVVLVLKACGEVHNDQ